MGYNIAIKKISSKLTENWSDGVLQYSGTIILVEPNYGDIARRTRGQLPDYHLIFSGKRANQSFLKLKMVVYVSE